MTAVCSICGFAFLSVMPAHSCSKSGVASLAYVAGIHVFTTIDRNKDVDGRDKPGHDDGNQYYGRYY